MHRNPARKLKNDPAIAARLAVFVTGTNWVQGPTRLGRYRYVPEYGSRLVTWMAAQLHLMIASYLQAVSMFALHSSFAAHIQQMRECRHHAI